jgi:putative glutathione S-transferase
MEQEIRILQEQIEKAGAARSQEEYEAAYDSVYEILDGLDALLADRDYLAGDQMTEADQALFDILVRLDIIYYFAYRLNRKRLREFPGLWSYAKRLYRLPEYRARADFEQIKKDFYEAQSDVRNPYHLIPVGPDLSLWEVGA